VICTVSPATPSDVVVRDTDLGPAGERAAHDLSRLRGTTPAGLRRRLAGDLDRIVLTAMQKDVALRYGSVPELLHDLTRLD
jgi:hypothetical protein